MRPPFLTYCSHAHYIRNKYTGEMICVPCRKCLGCRMHESSVMSARISSEESLHPYNLFFTLTYDNFNLPVAIPLRSYMDNLFSCGDYMMLDCLREFLLDKYPEGFYDRMFIYVSSLDEVFLLDSLGFDGFDCLPPFPTNYYDDAEYCFGVLNKIDIQRFLKRLRSLLKYDKYGLLSSIPKEERTFRYYVCGEYGPTTLRPHYHGLFFCDKKEISDAILSCYLHQAWKLCDKDGITCEYVTSSASSYVSSYVTSSFNLPKVLASLDVKPFRLYSRLPTFGIDENLVEKTFVEIGNGNVSVNTTRVAKDGTLQQVSIPLSLSAVNKLYPKCTGFKAISHDIDALALRYFPFGFNGCKTSLKSNILFYNPSFEDVSGACPWNETNIRCARVARSVLSRFGLTPVDYLRNLVIYWSNVESYNQSLRYKSLEQTSNMYDVFASSDDYYLDIISCTPVCIYPSSVVLLPGLAQSIDYVDYALMRNHFYFDDEIKRCSFFQRRIFDIPFLRRYLPQQCLDLVQMTLTEFFLNFYEYDIFYNRFCFVRDNFYAYVQSFKSTSVASSYELSVINSYQKKLYRKKINNSPYSSLISTDKHCLL